MIDGVALDPARVTHVKRSFDRACPARGVGVVEQHLRTLDRVAGEEAYEADALRNGAVPSVAVITPNPGIGEGEAKAAKTEWLAKFGGNKREPAILPAGTQVIPLAWSPEDAQLIAARSMSLLDIANIFNLDGYWTGAPGGSMTYRSPGAMYTNLLRVSLEPVLADFEDVWSRAWIPRGQVIKFNRNQLTRDDMMTTVQTLVLATAGDKPLMTVEEARIFLQLPPALPPTAAPPPAPAPEPTPEPTPAPAG
jgi:phage portal protein BeeE